MPKRAKRYRVQVRTIEGSYVPYESGWRLMTLAEASMATFASKLQGMHSRIIEDWDDKVVWSGGPSYYINQEIMRDDYDV